METLYFFFVDVGIGVDDGAMVFVGVGFDGAALAVTPFAGGTTGLAWVVAPPTWLIGLVGPPTLLCANAGAARRARSATARGRQVLLFKVLLFKVLLFKVLLFKVLLFKVLLFIRRWLFM